MQVMMSDQWDETLWQKVKSMYVEAFGNHGGKPEKVIQNMFKKQLCSLHLAIIGNDVVGMALTGFIPDSRILLIDYLTIKKDVRGQGIGKEFVRKLTGWALEKGTFDFVLLEAEAEPTPKNISRIQFWEKCGFKRLTDYTHQYIWVPEPYTAMVLGLNTGLNIPVSGKGMFRYIEKFHKKSYQKQ